MPRQKWETLIAWGTSLDASPSEEEVLARIDVDVVREWLRRQLPANATSLAQISAAYSILGDCLTLIDETTVQILLHAVAEPDPQSVVWRIVHDTLKRLIAREALRDFELMRSVA